MDYCKIGQQIRRIRKACGLSQEELAEKADISTTHMSHIETGSTKLSLPVLVAIAAALDTRVDDILYPGKSVKTTARYIQTARPFPIWEGRAVYIISISKLFLLFIL